MRSELRKALLGDDIIVAPGVFDMVSTLIADQLEFPALFATGFGLVASHLGLPDAGIAGYTDMVGRIATICARIKTPLIADADTGYGGLLNVDFTVRGYEAAGVAAIQIEDQEFPKKCGHTPFRRVIPAGDMARKIEVARKAITKDMLLIARTDARTGLGLDEAIRRGQLYRKAGADIIFVESPESIDEMARIADEIDAPLVANMVVGGRTPLLSARQLQDIGYKIALFPLAAFLPSAGIMRAALSNLKESGEMKGTDTDMSFAAFSKLIGFDRLHAFEAKYSEIE